jgi:hypothetical protein
MDQAVIVTYTGKEFDVLHPDPSLICLEDIAHALSQTCRFTGHTSRFYSVAEHSYHCSKLVAITEHQRACLLHDAAEAYLNDIASPVKQHLPEYNEFEENLICVIFNKYALYRIAPWDERIKDADKYMLRSEIHSLMPQHLPAFEGVFLERAVDEFPVPVEGWYPEIAKKKFLQRAKELGLGD